MFRFKFGQKSDGRSGPIEYINKLDSREPKLVVKLMIKLETIERRMSDKNIEQMLQIGVFKEIKHIQKQRERLFQINQSSVNKREFRMLFIVRGEIGLILNIFLKKSSAQQKKEYIKAVDSANDYY